jgi:serine/threonine protein phosphatase PrpC
LGAHGYVMESARAVQLTRDHRPELPEELLRICAHGGAVEGAGRTWRVAKTGVAGTLNMSRSLGDLDMHRNSVLSCTPDISERALKGDDQYLLICSDGVWDKIKPEKAISVVCQYGVEKAHHAADKLAKAAWDRWISDQRGAVVDDITVVLVHLQHSQPHK